jgi:hypothetical protein
MNRPGRRRLLAPLAAGVACVVAINALVAGARPGDAASQPPAILFGASVASQAQLAIEVQQFGAMPVSRLFYPDLPPATAWQAGSLGATLAASGPVVVSFNAPPAAIVSGGDDALLRAFFADAPTGHTVYYSYIHEVDKIFNPTRAAFTPADYDRAWSHVVALATSVHRPNLVSMEIFMGYSLEQHRPLQELIPPGHVTSTLGWDVYPSPATPLAPPASFMAGAAAFSKAHGLPFGYAEFGTQSVQGRGPWLTSVGRYASQSGALFATLFNANQGGSFTLTDQASIRAWRDVVAGSSVPRGATAPPGMSSPTPSAVLPAPPGAIVTPTPQTTPPPTISDPEETAMTITPGTGAGATTTISAVVTGAETVRLDLEQNGHLVREGIPLSRGKAGRISATYAGWDGSGHIEPAGEYSLVIVARNDSTTVRASLPLTLT